MPPSDPWINIVRKANASGRNNEPTFDGALTIVGWTLFGLFVISAIVSHPWLLLVAAAAYWWRSAER